MKKNISINLQGMIFHIEEDGYEQLSQYLAAIKTYFSTYQGHEEIIGDIEARIAEIFYSKLSPTKQVITREDVQALIAQMGSLADFQVMEDDEAYTGESQQQANPETASEPASKRIYSDQSRKIVGGVAAGVANYLNTDPLWVRLFLVFLLFIAPFTAGISAGFVVVAYLLCWISFPKSYTLPETSSRKLFRDPRDKKLGGVASGMAYFLGMDVAVIRLLFLISVFLGGFGIIAYIVLWIIVPEASSITDQARMQGNPVTLSGIEESLKSNLRMRDENGQESTLARIVLFPVRLIAQVLQFLSRVLNPLLLFLVALIRILAGVLLLVVGGAIIFALFIMSVTALGIVDGSSIISTPGDMPLSVFTHSFPAFGLVSGFFAILIPCLFLLLVGLGLLLKRLYLRPAVGWSLFGIWIVSLFVLTLGIIHFRNNFHDEGEVTVQKTFPTSAYETVTLKSRYNDEHWGDTHLEFQSYPGQDVKLIQTFQAKGLTEAEARKNATMITYRSVQRDSVITLDDRFQYKPNAVFRDQELHLKLLLPENRKFRFTRDFAWRLGSEAFDRDYNNINEHGDDYSRYVWQVKNNKLTCLNCPPPDTTNLEQQDIAYEEDVPVGIDSPLEEEGDYKGENRSFNLSDFDQVRVSGAYHVRIRRGDAYKVVARGPGRELRNLIIRREGNQLVIKPKKDLFDLDFVDHEPVLITLQLPRLRAAELSGAVKADIAGFEAEDFSFSASGAVESALAINSRNLRVDASGACHTTLSGKGENLEIDGTGACKIQANRFRASNADVALAGASNARVFVTNHLEAKVSGASHISYHGNPGHVSEKKSGAGSIEKD